jgi:hypothetical protein
MLSRILTVAAILSLCGAVFSQKFVRVQNPADMPSFVGYVQDECIVVLKDTAGDLTPTVSAQGHVTVGRAALDDVSRRFKVTRLKRQFEQRGPGATIPPAGIRLSRYYKARFTQGKLDDVLAAYAADPSVDHVEPIGIHRVYQTPNDAFFPVQWHLNQSSDRDIDATEAWGIERGSESVIVSIFDTGVKYFHRDLGGKDASYANPRGADGNMWINWAEKNGAPGVDDDHNGFVDDWVGWDFVDGVTDAWPGEDGSTTDNDPRDFNGHGTHCAGNVGALNNNTFATSSPSGGWGDGASSSTGNGVKVMACRIGWSALDPKYGEVGFIRMDFAAEAFYYAANNGAKIVSCSWGSSNSGGIAAAVGYFVSRGGLIFKAAGNANNESADYLCTTDSVISVAATDANDCRASFSTYGT